MAYRNVRFIGYVIDTTPTLNPDGSTVYLGLPNPRLDIEARCNLMLRAMKAARDALPPQSPPVPPGDTLNVFLAPKSFFGGASGAYAIDDAQLAIQALQDMAAKDEWTDWMFAFGTIPCAPSGIDPLAGMDLYNFALVHLGGAAAPGDTGARTVMNELLSGADFTAVAANPGGLLLGNVQRLAPSSVRAQEELDYDGAGIFELAGITWGLGVSPDNDSIRRLQKSPQLPGENQVQVQLVPSCDMRMEPSYVITQFGGYAFNCDGSRNARHSTLLKMIPPLSDIALAASTPVGADPIALQSTSPVVNVPVGDLYASGAGVINLYPSCALPEQQTVPGSVVRLVWQASRDYAFVFQLVYDANGSFVTLACELRSRKAGLHDMNYFLPLTLQTRDTLGQDVKVQMMLVPGSNPYAGAVWCRILVPGFIFEGNAFAFSATKSGPPPLTIW